MPSESMLRFTVGTGWVDTFLRSLSDEMPFHVTVYGVTPAASDTDVGELPSAWFLSVSSGSSALLVSELGSGREMGSAEKLLSGWRNTVPDSVAPAVYETPVTAVRRFA